MRDNHLVFYQLISCIALVGLMAMPRTPISRLVEDNEAAIDETGSVDASLLPPG